MISAIPSCRLFFRYLRHHHTIMLRGLCSFVFVQLAAAMATARKGPCERCSTRAARVDWTAEPGAMYCCHYPSWKGHWGKHCSCRVSTIFSIASALNWMYFRLVRVFALLLMGAIETWFGCSSREPTRCDPPSRSRDCGQLLLSKPCTIGCPLSVQHSPGTRSASTVSTEWTGRLGRAVSWSTVGAPALASLRRMASPSTYWPQIAHQPETAAHCSLTSQSSPLRSEWYYQ